MDNFPILYLTVPWHIRLSSFQILVTLAHGIKHGVSLMDKDITTAENEINKLENDSDPQLDFCDSINSGSDRSCNSVDSVDNLRYHRIEDFVAEAKAFDNVLITYEPLEACVTCKQKFYPTDLTIIYHPLRTKNKCKKCKLVVYTIINSYKRKKVSESTYGNKCDLNVEPKKQTELNENDKCSNQNKKTKVSSDPFISSKKNKSDAIQCNFSSNVNSDFFSNDDTLSKDCQLQSTKNTFGRFPK